MYKISMLVIGVILSAPPMLWAADAPHRLGGFVLGGSLDDFRDRLEMETRLPVRYAESLKEVEVREIPGFKSGLVYYSTCNQPGTILRLEFKYRDSSKAFYDELLRRFKKRLGDPDEWRGDPFHIQIGWKWQFVDAHNNNISLILKHNTQDEEKKEGNTVKMTMWNLMNAEIHCYKKAHETGESSSLNKIPSGQSGTIDWDLLIPR